MNRIVNVFDDPNPNESLIERTQRGYGIAGRYPDHKMDYEQFSLYTALEPFNGDGTFQLCFSKNGKKSVWYIGMSQDDRLGVLFEDGTQKFIEVNDYKKLKDYKKAVYDYFKKYIDNGYELNKPLYQLEDESFEDI
ncbi:MAG: hypothetical protein J6T10_17040 [Methanobrevibacter sp.]|nr:hypothetical protein [Methanobrevibacter sp.]